MSHFSFALRAAPGFVAAILLVPVALAQGLFGKTTDYASVELHAGRDVGAGERLTVLRMELKPGWKTYWRNPGDAGIPPHFDWAGSSNLKSVTVDWPTPVVFDTYGSRTIGYEQRMTLPLMMTPEDPIQPIKVRLNFTYGLCSEICIPAQADIALTIPPGAPEDGGYFLDLAYAETAVDAAAGGLTIHACRVEGAGEERLFHAAFTVDQPFVSQPVVIAEGPEGVWFGPTELRVADGVIIAEGPVETAADQWIERSALSLTLLGLGRAVTQHGCAPKS